MTIVAVKDEQMTPLWRNATKPAHRLKEVENLGTKKIRRHPSPGLHCHSGPRLTMLYIFLAKFFFPKNIEYRDCLPIYIDSNQY
jgi:hypothetical protein